MNSKNTTVYVNGEAVDPYDVDELRSRMEEAYRERYADELEPDELNAKLDEDAEENAIDELLLKQAALAAGLKVSDREVKNRFNRLKQEVGGSRELYRQAGLTSADDPHIREQIREQLMIEKYLTRLGQDVPRPGDDECRAIFDRSPDRFVIPEMVLASEISQSASLSRPPAEVFADMMNIRQAILDGAEFSAVARMVSGDKKEDGNLGYVARGMMSPAFDEVAFALSDGEVSEVFVTEYGYHLVQVFHRREEEARSYESIQEILRDELWEKRRNERSGREADVLRKRAEIRRFEEEEE